MPTGPSKDALLAHLAAGRHGVVTAAEAASAGMSPDDIRRRVRKGTLRRIHPGVLHHTAAPFTYGSRLAAAQLWGGPGSFLSHRSAGRLWELEAISGEPVEVSITGSRTCRGVEVHRLRAEDRPRTVRIQGFVVSAADRTLLDLAGVLGRKALGLALDDALRRRLTSLDGLKATLDATGGRGRRGSRTLREALAQRDADDPLLASRFEKKMLTILRRIGGYVAQYEVPSPAGRFFLDFAFPAAMLAIECHSRRWHDSHFRFEKDVARDRALKTLGWTVLYFSWSDVTERPDAVETEIRSFLNRAEKAADSAGFSEKLVR